MELFSYKRNYMYQCVRVHTNTLIHQFRDNPRKIEANRIHLQLTLLESQEGLFSKWSLAGLPAIEPCLFLNVIMLRPTPCSIPVYTLLPKGANRTNSQPSSQDRCQSHWWCSAVFKSVRLCLLWQKYCTHPFLIYIHVRVRAMFIDIYDEFSLCLIVAHTFA